MRITYILVLSIVAGNAPLAAQSSDHLALGAAAIEARNPAAALEHYRVVLATDSMHYEANWRAALALIDLGSEIPDSVESAERDSLYADAVRHARRAVAANPDGADGYFALANALGRVSLTRSGRERLQLAVEIRDAARRAIALNPGHDGAHHILGRWHAEVMRLSGVTKFLARTFLGADVINEASWDSAIHHLKQAVELDPTRIIHRFDLAEVYLDRERYADARTQLEAIAGLPPVHLMDPVYRRRAALLLRELPTSSDD